MFSTATTTATPATDRPTGRPTPRGTRRGLAALLGLTALALATAACGGDEPEGAGAESIARDTEAPPDSAPASDETGTTQTPEAEATPSGDETGTGSDEGSSLEPSAADTPEDQALDIEQRHPIGMTLRVTGLTFEGHDIAVDVEVINGADNDMTFVRRRYVSQRLRLVDDAGQTYNFVDPPEGDYIELAPGESLEGTLRFRGPLHGRPDQLMLVTNLRDDELSGFDIDEQPDSITTFPAFLVPLDLEWV